MALLGKIPLFKMLTGFATWRLGGASLPAGEAGEDLARAVSPWLHEARLSHRPSLRHGPAGAEAVDQRSCIVAPLVAQNELLGMLYDDLDGTFGRLHDADRDLIAMLAAQAAVALANLRTNQGLEVKVAERTEQLERRASELAVINSIQRGMAAALDFQAIVELMNDPPSDVNESIIDIFVLSVSETVTSLFTEHLEKKGYRVTLFNDGRYLLDTLREGKPNLLICDTTTLDEEGFEVCRHIKAHEDYWVIPVFILTRGASITDLLRILDCNADNFITHPFDLSFCLSIIDSLLSVPVERQTPDQIKTQFKISHNDQIYVVSANRRKLLEFLLSSFEITATQSSV